jgi:hypothetical protein
MLQFFTGSNPAPIVPSTALQPLFASYVARFDKSYTNAEEYNMRFQTWADRHQFITEFNQKLEAEGKISQASAHRVGHN